MENAKLMQLIVIKMMLKEKKIGKKLDFDKIAQMENSYQLKTYSKLPIAVEKAHGVYVYDSSGRKYLDFYGGHAVCGTGHCHPSIVKAISQQAKQLIFYSNSVYNSTRAKAAKAVVGLAPDELTKVFFCNSGAEANETAIKISRKFTGKSKIISMSQGFHGRTFGAMSATGIAKYRIFPPMVPGVEFAEFGNIDSVKEKILSGARNGMQNGTQNINVCDVSCIILEPVQSMAGVRIAHPDFYKKLRKLCTEKGIVLIFDEVQTGFGRTGKNFFAQTIGVTPDIITCAKGIASGIPMGAVIVKDDIAKSIGLGEQGSTFGGSPIASAAALATAQVIAREKLAENARKMGDYLMAKLIKAGIKNMASVRGAGLIIGVEFKQDAKPLVKAMLNHGIIISPSEDAKTIRLLPPLIINKSHCDELIQKLKLAADEVFA